MADLNDTPLTDAVDVPDNWDTPDKLADLCRKLERGLRAQIKYCSNGLVHILAREALEQSSKGDADGAS